MALELEKDYRYGLKATYWSIDELNISYLNKTAHAVLCGYINEDSKKIKLEAPLFTEPFDWNKDTFNFIKDGGNIGLAYGSIKETKPERNPDDTIKLDDQGKEIESNPWALAKDLL